MTSQIHDKVFFKETEFNLVSLNGEGVFEPSIYGMLPKMLHTACWCGYYCSYTVERFDLLLTNLTIRTHNGHYPPIDGISAIDDGFGTMRYIGLRLPMEFHGNLLLRVDFIQEKYNHMGFQGQEAYQKVIELPF